VSWSHRAPARRSPIRTARVTRQDEAHVRDMQLRAEGLAVAFGYCTCCGQSVDEANGKLHDWDCIDVAPERRQVRA